MSDNSSSSYKQILKATSIFGGVQVFIILITIIRSKVVALLLGPAGMGIAGLITSTTVFINNLTNFGITTAAVKNIADAFSSNNATKLGKTVSVFRKLVWVTGLLGLVVTLLFSPLLSKISFGNFTYTIFFAFASITLLINQLSEGETTFLRGVRKIKELATSSFIGALTGLVFSIPLYYFFKENGIVPALIISSISTFLSAWYFTSKASVVKVSLLKSEIFSEGREMLKIGFLINLSNLVTLGASFLVRVYISHAGGITDVGLYTAGFSIVGSYVSLVFTAMSTDYYPRLSTIAADNSKCEKEINQQAEIGVLILSPMLITLIVFGKLIIILLYSTKFTAIITMIQWAALGILFKAISWPIAFLFLAKGASKQFFYNELFASIYMLAFNIYGYYLFKLDGLGISYVFSYLVYFVHKYAVSKYFYNIAISKSLIKIFVSQFLIAFLCVMVIQNMELKQGYFFGVLFCIVSFAISIKQLNTLIGLKAFFNRKLLKRA